MKKILIIFIFFSNFFLFSQTEKKYDLYFYFDSCKEEMNVTTKKLGKNVLFKTFRFSKIIPKEDYKYSLSIDNHGNLLKGIKGATGYNNDQIRLSYLSSKHDKIILNNFLLKNVIDYDLFINAEFKTCIRLLRNANKIYMIDKKENNDFHFTAYQVSF